MAALVTSRYLTSAIGTSQLLSEALRAEDGRQVPVAWYAIDGESLVHRARNNIVAAFMAARPEMSHLIFVDADIEWSPRDLLRLIGHDLPVMCGIYPKKTEPAEFPFHPLLDENGVARRNPVTGAIQIANGPTGFLCVKREVFVQMREAYPQLKFACPKASAAELEWLYAYFDTYVEEGILWSEDYGFCRRWRALGGEIWCDPEIRLGHVGSTDIHGLGRGSVSAGRHALRVAGCRWRSLVRPTRSVWRLRSGDHRRRPRACERLWLRSRRRRAHRDLDEAVWRRSSSGSSRSSRTATRSDRCSRTQRICPRWCDTTCWPHGTVAKLWR